MTKEEELQQSYLSCIIETANKPSFPYKIENLNKLLIKYFLFCQKNGLSTFNKDLKESLEKLTILDVPLKTQTIDNSEVREVISHLEEINEKNKVRLMEGLSLEETELLLNWMVETAKENIKEQSASIRENVAPQFAQSILYYIGKELNLEVTANDDTVFPNVFYPTHFFSIVKIPVATTNGIVLKSFLLDAYFSKLFRFSNCHEGLLVEQKSLDAGYYLCKSEKGINFSKELLGNGYIELSFENAKLYGMAFALSSHYKSEDMLNTCIKVSEREYFNAMFAGKKVPNIRKSALEHLGFSLELPVEYLL